MISHSDCPFNILKIISDLNIFKTLISDAELWYHYSLASSRFLIMVIFLNIVNNWNLIAFWLNFFLVDPDLFLGDGWGSKVAVSNQKDVNSSRNGLDPYSCHWVTLCSTKVQGIDTAVANISK